MQTGVLVKENVTVSDLMHHTVPKSKQRFCSDAVVLPWYDKSLEQEEEEETKERSGLPFLFSSR